MKEKHISIINKSLSVASQEILNLKKSVRSDEIEMLIGKIIDSASSGNIILTGVGTSGVAANKIVHSLRCQSLPAFFLSSEDALHGASGAIRQGDLFIVISNGGTSSAVNQCTMIAKERGALIIAVTADRGNTLGRLADEVVVVKVEQESDYVGLLATASILCVIALFDAVCSVLMAEKNFTRESFSHIHPEGKVGQDISSKHEEGGA